MSIQAKKLYPVGNGRITVSRQFEDSVSIEDCIQAVLRHTDTSSEDDSEKSTFGDAQARDMIEV